MILFRTNLDHEILKGIAKLPRIKNLIIIYQQGDTLGEKGAATLSTMKDLETLCLLGFEINPEMVEMISRIKSLKFLDMIGLPGTLKAESISSLKNLTNLESLSITCDNLDSGAVNDLADLKRLKTLNLCNCTISSFEIIENLSRLENLTSLHLVRNKFLHFSKGNINKLKTLEELYMDENDPRILNQFKGVKLKTLRLIRYPYVTSDFLQKLNARNQIDRIELLEPMKISSLLPLRAKELIEDTGN